MSFLAIDAQKNYFTLQRNQLQFELTVIMAEASRNLKVMDAIKSASPDSYDEDDDYIQAEELDEVLETEKDSIESQINLLDNEISSLKSMVNNNIKNSCGLQLIGG